MLDFSRNEEQKALLLSQKSSSTSNSTNPVYEEHFTYDDNGNISSKSCFIDREGDGKIDFEERFIYDDNGNLYGEIFSEFSSDGNISYREIFCYDENGNIEYEEISEDEDKNGIIDTATTYIYDEDGTLVNETHSKDTDNNGTLDYEESVLYSKNGEKFFSTTLSQDTDNDGELDFSETVRKDENDTILNKSQTTYNDEGILSNTAFYYDKNGKIFLTQETNYQDGEISKVKTMEDENLDGINDIEIIKTYDLNGEVIDTQYNINLDDSDQEIGLTRQNAIGDCWLLAGLYALNNTPSGKEIIKEAITPNSDGSYDIYFKGIDTSYTITKEEIINAKLQDIYSKGDIDTLIMELAFEKAFSDKNNANTDIPDLNEDILNIEEDEEEHVLDGGHFNYVTYLLTGQNTTLINNHYLKNVNPKETPTFLAFTSGTTITDIEGNKIVLCGGENSAHAWSLKTLENGIATIINPHNSKEEVKVDIDDLIKTVNHGVYLFDNTATYNTNYYYANEEPKSIIEKLFDFILFPINLLIS